MKLTRSFYLRNDVVEIARDLLGKVLVTNFDGKLTTGIINETEAYAGATDKASHAYNNLRSKRTEIMYTTGGMAYVYLCYGVHSLFNVVTNKKEIPHAVLIRGIIPQDGKDIMSVRAGRNILKGKDTNGPGKLSKALGIHYSHTGIDLCGDLIWLEDRKVKVRKSEIKITKRIGIEYAGEDADLPYRFVLGYK